MAAGEPAPVSASRGRPDVSAEAVSEYIAGNPLACAQSLIPTLPRTDARNLLLLFTSLADLDMTGLLEQLAPSVLGRLGSLALDDPELWSCFQVAMGVVEPASDIEAYQDPKRPHLALWASRRLGDEQGELARALLGFSVRHLDHPSVEGLLAARLLRAEPQTEDRGTSVERARLTFDVLKGLERVEMLDGASSALVGAVRRTGDLRALFAAVVERAFVLRHLRQDSAEAIDLVTRHHALFEHADAQVLNSALFLFLDAPPESTPELDVIAALVEAFERVGPRADTAHLGAVMLQRFRDSDDHRRRMFRFIVEADALSEASDDAFEAIAAEFITAGGFAEWRYLEHAIGGRPNTDATIRVHAALLADRTPDGQARPATRLLCAAAALRAEPATLERATDEVLLLGGALLTAGETDAAARLTWSALRARGYRVDDTPGLELAMLGTNCLLRRDALAARALLRRCVESSYADVDAGSDAVASLLLALVRVEKWYGDVSGAIVALYELRYCCERLPDLPKDVVIEAASELGWMHAIYGSFGAAQKYLQEPFIRGSLEGASESVMTRARGKFAIVKARIADIDDAEYQAVVEEVFGEPEKRDSVPLPPMVTSPVEPLSPLTYQRVSRQLESDWDRTLTAVEATLEYIESSPLRDGVMHTVAQQILALGLAERGPTQRALDVWLESVRRSMRHIADFAAVGPVEDIREAGLSAAYSAEMTLALAQQTGWESAGPLLETIVSLRSLWSDLRLERRALGADAAGPRRAAIAEAARATARLLMDGPPQDRTQVDAYFEELSSIRRRRDLEEIGGIWRRTTGAELARKLQNRFDASVRRLGDRSAFVGYYRFSERRLVLPALSGRIPEPSAERYVAILLWKGKYTAVPLGEANALDGAANTLAEQLRADALKPHRDDRDLHFAEDLARTLVEPVLDAYGRSVPEQIYVVADGALAQLPWELLFSRRGVEPATAHLVHSFRSIGRERSSTVRLTPEALVVGGPRYGTEAGDEYEWGIRSFRELPTTEVEANVVAGACGCSPVTAEDARPECILGAAPGGVLHIASHGYALTAEGGAHAYETASDQLGAELFTPREDLRCGPLEGSRFRDPMLHSGIAMAGANHWLAADGRAAADCGLVTAEDLSWCDLSDVDCVVLSACASGAGEGSRMAGSRGMRFAALAAGASWAITSLWPVPDVATSVLVEWLYESFGEGLAPPDALIRAQARVRTADLASILSSRTISAVLDSPGATVARAYLTALERALSRDSRPFEHPYYWCGFVCSC